MKPETISEVAEPRTSQFVPLFRRQPDAEVEATLGQIGARPLVLRECAPQLAGDLIDARGRGAAVAHHEHREVDLGREIRNAGPATVVARMEEHAAPIAGTRTFGPHSRAGEPA